MTMNMPKLQQLFTTDGSYSRRSAGQLISFDSKNPSVGYVKTGFVKRYSISKLGVISVQSIYGPGYLFPLTAVFHSVLDQKIYMGDEQYYYEAVIAAEIYNLTGDNLRAAVNADPLVYKELLAQAGIRLQSNIHYLENMALKDPYSRLAHMLVYYAKNFGEETPQGIKIIVPFKHQDIADVLNVSRESISRAVSKLHEKNLIDYHTDIYVPDVALLKAIYE